MALHPHMVVALTRLDDFEQDVLERLCDGDWDRVSYDFENGLVYRDGRQLVFRLQEPLDDFDPEQYFEHVIDLDAPKPEITKVTLYEDEAGTKPVGVWRPHIIGRVSGSGTHGECLECGDKQAQRGGRCPKLSSGERPPEEWHLDASRLDEPGIPFVIEVPAGSHADEEEEQRVVAEADAALHEVLCKCGCGEPVVNKPTGRRKLYATDKCRHRVHDAKKTTPKVEASGECANPECDKPARPRQKDCSDTCRTRRASILKAKRRGVDVATPVLAEPVQQDEPEPEGPSGVTPPAPVQRRVWCARCEQDGHYVEDCTQPMTRRKAKVDTEVVATSSTPVDAPVEDASQRSVREAKERLAQQKKAVKGEAPEQITCGRCLEKGHSIFTCSKPAEPKVHLVRPPQNQPLTDDELTAHSTSLQQICKDGLPEHFQYSYKDDVLALYGVDTDLMDACLRAPERVEVRPESFDKEKRYCVLAFYKGDLEVILGMRNPGAPMVIAAYATSRLEHDTHRVGHTGGGGSKSGGERGLPKTSRAVAQRLRSLGAEVEVDVREDHTTVMFKGQDLGKIACNGDRKTCEQDFQRVQRKIAAIERRTVNASVG